MASESVAQLFVDFSRWKLLDEYWPRMRGCVESLTQEQVWWRPNESSNSIGNLLMHLDGNVRQWLVHPFEGSTDTRDRPGEFAARGGAPIDDLVGRLETTLAAAGQVLNRLTDGDLRRALTIQGYDVTGLDAVYQVVEHFGMHYGQVLYITKLLRAENLGFYRELDATGRVGP